MKTTPIELATLSAHLVQSGIIKMNPRNLSVAASALKYLGACEEALSLREQAQNTKEKEKVEWTKTERFLKPYPQDGTVPVTDIVAHYNVQQLKPSDAELEAVGEKRQWSLLSQRDRKEVVFLVLTRQSRTVEAESLNDDLRATIHKSTFTAPSIKEARAWVKSGVPIHSVVRVLQLIKASKVARQAELGAEGASKRRKPRTPKGGDGRFEAKARNERTGAYKKQ
jgi:hypothetical protein